MFSYDLLNFLFLGFLTWYATGIDDALIFGGIMSGAKTTREKMQATLGLLAMYVVMVVIVISVGKTFTLMIDYPLMGIPLKQFIFFFAMLLVIKYGLDAWNGTAEDEEDEDRKIPNSWYERFVWMIGGIFPKIAQDSFKGFGLNCTDDIAVNSANIIGKTNMEVFWYLVGNAVGVLSMIAVVWMLYGLLQYFADKFGKSFDKVRACSMWFAAFLIYRSAM